MIFTLLLIAIGGCASFLLPCTTPFIALGVTALYLGGARRALIVVGSAWAIDELLGFTLFGYPHTRESYALGLLALVSAIASLAACRTVRARQGAPWLAFAAAAAVFEATFAAGTFALGMSLASFAPEIDAWVVGANALFFAAFELGRRFEGGTVRT